MAEIATIDYKLGQDNVQVFGLDIHNPVFVVSKALFMTVWRLSTRSAENSCGIRQS